MHAAAFDDDAHSDAMSPQEAAQVASLDFVAEKLRADAMSWAEQLGEFSALAARAERAGAQTRRTLALELAGSWRVSQLTAERWLSEAQWFANALPGTLGMLETGELLIHQAKKLLHGTSYCTPEVAQAIEAQVLPAGAALCPTDLERQVKRVRLRIQAEQADPDELARQEAAKVAGRRTWVRPTEDGMAVAGALLTPEQGIAWAAGMDALERRERVADRAAGIDRTAEQRRADLFAALPALVLAGTAQDDAHRRAAGVPGGRTGAPQPGEAGQPFRQTGPLFDDTTAGAVVLQPWAFSPDQVAARIILNIHVPVATILDRSQEPGTLDRYGPVSAEHVRLVRPHRVRRVMVDATTGRPIAVDDQPTPAADTPEGRHEQILNMLRPDLVVDRDEPQHDPSARLARLIDLRDVRCCGPGCSSGRCDRDHLQPHPHGPTNARNLGLASPRCHSAKHHGWQLIRHPDGSVTWHSPLHRHYNRPGPWNPPPAVDLPLDTPPRARPSTKPERGNDDDDMPLLDRLKPPEPQPDPKSDTEPGDVSGWDDEPPF